MSKNKTLSAAKSAKNDEFYTQYADIQKEINAYLDYDPDTFRGKTVLLPCDDPEWSKFTRFFAENFERLGLKKLISTSYAAASKKFFNAETQRRGGGRAGAPRTPSWYQPTLFEQGSPQFDEKKTAVRGKIFVLDHDTNANGRIDLDDLEWKYLEGDGDFRSEEVCKLRVKAEFEKGLPVVLMCHIPPYYPQEFLENGLASKRATLRGQGVAEENLPSVPPKPVQDFHDGRTRDFYDWLRGQKSLKAILCGHTHVEERGAFSDTADMIVAGGNFEGCGYELTFV